MPHELKPGHRIGRLVIESLVGRGGMGEVYSAYDEHLDRRVAVKALRQDRRWSQEQALRFLREARTLSRLDHPNICRIHDLIVEDDEQYLILELVEGDTLTRALEKGLDHETKLSIALDIASALAAAHQRQIVHRDLKPDNVMISTGGETRVLDFGLSRSAEEAELSPLGVSAPARTSDLAHSLGDEDGATVTMVETGAAERPPSDLPRSGQTVRTRHGAVVGTPAFMSPEQARGEPVTEATDLYSLGLVLQIMWSATSPYEPGLKAEEVLARARGAKTQRPTAVRSDIANLIEKLLTNEPLSRPSAAETVTILESIRDRTQRILRRVAGVAALVVAVTLGVGYVLNIQKERSAAVEARDDAVRAQEGLEQVVSYLISTFRGANPNQDASELTVADLLESGVDRLRTNLPEDPSVRVRILTALATVHRNLGLQRQAGELLVEAQATELPGDEPILGLNLLWERSALATEEGRFAEAEELARDHLALTQRLPPETNYLVSRLSASWKNLADALAAQQKYDEAVTALHETFKGDFPAADAWEANYRLGVVLSQAERHDQARPLLDRAIQLATEAHGENHFNTAITLQSAGIDATMERDYVRGERLLRRSLASLASSSGDDSLTYANGACNLANMLELVDRHEEALVEARTCREIVAKLDAGPFYMSWSGNRIASALQGLGQLEEAEAHFREGLATFRALDENHAQLPSSLQFLAGNLTQQGRYDEAEGLLEESLGQVEARHGVGNFRTFPTLEKLAEVRWRKGEIARARRTQSKMLDAARNSEVAARPGITSSLEDFVGLLRDLNRTEDVMEVEAALEELRVDSAVPKN